MLGQNRRNPETTCWMVDCSLYAGTTIQAELITCFEEAGTFPCVPAPEEGVQPKSDFLALSTKMRPLTRQE